MVIDTGATLRYHDPRRFGAILWVQGTPTPTRSCAGLGPEPFDPAFDADYLWRETRRRSAAIKLALMDNHLVVGVGNIYANESLFRARIRPTTPVHRVSKPRLDRLVVAIRATLTDAIAKGGSTLRDYVDSQGARAISSSTTPLRPRGCARSGLRHAIRAIRLGGRATSYCPALPTVSPVGDKPGPP